EGTQEFFDTMQQHGVQIAFLGGETADVGDVVRTIAVNGTMGSRWQKNKLITNEKIAPGNVIIGLASYGKSLYETAYNSGIGSNGLTSARHDVLSQHYKKYTETFEPSLKDEVVYIGKHKLTDPITINFNQEAFKTDIGHLILSPTRTFAPVLKPVLEQHFDDIYGLIHCSGGGQTKCMKYVPENVRIVKDNLFQAPEIFDIIQQASGADAKEMYQVFNMGCRMEIYTTEASVEPIIALATSLGIQAQVIGRVEASTQKELVIKTTDAEIVY
ncbi:MAG TPA: AIR synthase-related protein, partial [Flavisolibacter sp.]|nr:AIR synthase-related protein [Flavisolibacter sp.]